MILVVVEAVIGSLVILDGCGVPLFIVILVIYKYKNR